MFWIWFSIFGCSDKSKDSAEVKQWNSAELKPLSSGDCPDMSISGATTTFLSSGDERTVTTVFPSTPEPGMKVIFWFHGFLDSSMSNPTSETAIGMNFQALADQENALIIVPESGIWDLIAFEVYMWAIEAGTSDADLTLYDDLRTCAAQNFDIDLDKVTAGGFSGGALFSTVLLSQRGDTLAAVAQMSGGSDLNIDIMSLFEEPLSVYSTPAYKMPLLLASGQDSDIWPGNGMTIVNFYEATETLATKVRADDIFVVRCLHSNDHWSMPNNIFNSAMSWLTNHSYGEESPFSTDKSSLYPCE